MYKGMARETFLFVCLFVKYRNYLDLCVWIVVLDLSFFLLLLAICSYMSQVIRVIP